MSSLDYISDRVLALSEFRILSLKVLVHIKWTEKILTSVWDLSLVFWVYHRRRPRLTGTSLHKVFLIFLKRSPKKKNVSMLLEVSARSLLSSEIIFEFSKLSAPTLSSLSVFHEGEKRGWAYAFARSLILDSSLIDVFDIGARCWQRTTGASMSRQD